MGYQQFMENNNSMEKGFNPEVEKMESTQIELLQKHHDYNVKVDATTDEAERKVIKEFIADIEAKMENVDSTLEEKAA